MKNNKKLKLLLILPLLVLISSCSRDNHGVISSKLDIVKSFEEHTYYLGITERNDINLIISEDENDWKETLTYLDISVYPNPFNSIIEGCYIEINTSYHMEVTITIMQNPWTVMRTLNVTTQSGLNRLFYDGSDENGNPLPKGIYRVYITAQGLLDGTTFGDISVKRE